MQKKFSSPVLLRTFVLLFYFTASASLVQSETRKKHTFKMFSTMYIRPSTKYHPSFINNCNSFKNITSASLVQSETRKQNEKTITFKFDSIVENPSIALEQK